MNFQQQRINSIPDGDSPVTANDIPISNLQITSPKQQHTRAKRVYANNLQQQQQQQQPLQNNYNQNYQQPPISYQQQPPSMPVNNYQQQSQTYQQPYQQPGQPSIPYQQPGQQPGQPSIPYQQPGQPSIPYQQPGQPSMPINNYQQQPGQPSIPYKQPGQQPGQPSMPAQPPHRPAETPKIDPDQIPSPVPVQAADQELFLSVPYQTCSRTPPPLASTQFVAIDQGSCNPRFMRMTTGNIPCTDEILKASWLPLGIILQPLADLDPREEPLKVVNFGENGPIRCNRCKAYVNPFFQFIDGGRKFVCNLCTFENNVPTEYFSNVDMSGRRLDAFQRPELCFGSVEFVASKEYMSRPPNPISYVFAIDVSWNAIQSGILLTCLATIKDFLYSGQQPLVPGAKVAIITFDKDIHFFNLSSSLEQPQMIVMADVMDSFMPLSSGFLVDPYESRSVIENLLDSLPVIFDGNKVAEPALGAAIQTAYEALKNIGGKLLVFQTSLPTYGPGALKNREDMKLLGTDKERSLYEPQEFFWRKLGQDCATHGICVDMYLFSNTYIDVATIGCISSLSGGDIYMYPGFDAIKDGMKFANDLKYNLSRTCGFDALLRLRVSNGLKIDNHFGNFYMRNATDLEIAGLDSLKSFGVSLKHDGKLEERVDSHFQAALLYTTSTGERRIRVHNLQVPNSTVMSNIFKNAELDTTINFVSKSSISKMTSQPIQAIRDQMGAGCVKVLASYRLNCAPSTAPGQLILPESFKLYPLFALCLLKNRTFRSGVPVGTDLRVHAMRSLLSMSVPETVALLYPRMFQLHDISTPSGDYNENTGKIILPNCIRASGNRMNGNGGYLLENGQSMILWLGRGVSQEFLLDLFGVPELQMVDLNTRLLPELENEVSQRVRSVISQIRSERPRYLHLQIVRQQMDVLLEKDMISFLVEDQTNDNMSYVDYLCAIHKKIQADITSS